MTILSHILESKPQGALSTAIGHRESCSPIVSYKAPYLSVTQIAQTLCACTCCSSTPCTNQQRHSGTCKTQDPPYAAAHSGVSTLQHQLLGATFPPCQAGMAQAGHPLLCTMQGIRQVVVEPTHTYNACLRYGCPSMEELRHCLSQLLPRSKSRLASTIWQVCIMHDCGGHS